MRKVVLRMKEQFTYDIIKKLANSNGNKKNAALKLNCTLRTVNRLILKYKKEGKKTRSHISLMPALSLASNWSVQVSHKPKDA